VGKLNVVVLYDRWDPPDEPAGAPADKAPLTRSLDKKEVEDEVAETLGKLGHVANLHVLDGSVKSLHALARTECDLVFNLAESFAGNDTADYCIAAYLELIDKRFTGSGSHGLLYGQDKAVAKKILEFHGIHTPVIVKPAREDGSIGIEFNAVVRSIRELMERIDWLHANFDSPVLIEEYVEGREMYVGVIGNDNPVALPVVELDLSRLPEGRPRIAGAEVKWGKGTRAYRDTKSAIAEDLPEDTESLLQSTAVAVFQALELRDYARIDMRLRPDGRVAVIEANPNPWLASKAEFPMAARKSGRNYTQLIEEIVELSLARYGAV
jgi:D-alanine-D-alanine ligase